MMLRCFEVKEVVNLYDCITCMMYRFPSDEWRCLGTMLASNEREIQSFPLRADESIYAKYVRVEMISHYGSEHFCPLSLLRVIGASMMEVNMRSFVMISL